MGPLIKMTAEEERDWESMPALFRCPISLEVMRDPVSVCTGVTYERGNIQKWMEAGNNVCPATMEALHSQELIPNHTLRRFIQQWCLSKGFDSFSPPKSPANPSKIRRMVQDIINADEDNVNKALESLTSLKDLVKSSPRNAMCMQALGILRVLAQLISSTENKEILQEAVALLSCFQSVELVDDDDDNDADADATGQPLLRGIAIQMLPSLEFLLLEKNMEARMNTAILVEFLLRDIHYAREVGSRETIISSLISLVREGIEEAVNASVSALFNLCAVTKNRVKIIEAADAISALTEVINGSGDKKVRERALGVLEALSTTAEGRAAIDDHTLALSAVVKSLLTISASADEYSVAIIWRLCFKSGEVDGDTLNHNLLQAAFNKLLLLMQIDSASPITKVKANQLLKLFSPMRH
uniref:RING-type E3 ubiquitin transferase n=1 Tax=Araucaria cunninghamii TaxID=56994 RepID=A0A0D6R7X6_ARACU